MKKWLDAILWSIVICGIGYIGFLCLEIIVWVFTYENMYL